jgi:Bacterial TniB protein
MLNDPARSEQQHLEDLRADLVRRLRVRERQLAQVGVTADPIVFNEIEDLQAQIADIDTQLHAPPPFATPPATVAAPPYAANPAHTSRPSGNPFTPGAVAHPDRFIGRQHELAAILSRLENMLSLSLVGQARIGKSSILRYLEARLPTLLASHGDYLPIYISMDSQRSQQSFCRAILERLLPHMPPLPGQEPMLRALEQRVANGSPLTLDEAVRTLESAAGAGLRVVLLLDEFKDLLERPVEFDQAFRGVLRSLYSNQTTALLTAARQPLTEIDGLDAYFVNGFTQQRLDLLREDEAEALLRQPSDRPLNAEEVRLGLDVGRRHPLRLQEAGFQLYISKTSPPGPLHESNGALSDRAPTLLGRMVQETYDSAIAASSAHPARKRGIAGWFEAIGGVALRTGAAADTAQTRVMGVFIVLAVIVIFGLLLACGLGAISLEDLGRLLRLIAGGSS